MRVDGPQALARVRADLGRDPTDRFEAAVVLERSGGLIGEPALALGAEAFARCSTRRPATGGRPIVDPGESSTGVAAVAMVLVSLVWAGTLGRGGALVDPAGALVCLPVGLGLVGYLDRCYFGGPLGRGRTRTHLLAILVIVAGGCAAVAVVAPGASGPGVVVVLVLAAAATRLRLAGPVITTLVIGALVARLGVSGPVAAFGSLAVAVLVVVVQVRRTPPDPVAPGPARLGLLRGTAGAGLGLLTMPVIAHTIDLALQEPLLLILPSTLGGAAASTRLERIWHELPDAMRATEADARSDGRLGRRYRWLVLSGAFLGATVTGVASIVVVLVADGVGVAAVLVALAAIAAQGFGAAVLHGMATEVEVSVVSVLTGVSAAGATVAGVAATVAVPAAVAVAHLVWLPLIVQIARDPEQVIAGQL